MKLKIKQSSWSGWSKDYKPEEVENEYEIKLNEKYVIKTMKFSHQEDEKWVEEEREVLSFTISEINDSSIKINTYQEFLENGNGNDQKKEFIITDEKSLELVTPTLDQGDIFIFTLTK